MAGKILSRHRSTSHFRKLLSHRNFGFYFAASSISTLGTSVAQLGLSLALLVAGYKPFIVGLVLASQTVPMLVFTLAGGVFAIAADAVSYLLSAALLTFVRFPAGGTPLETASFLTELKHGAIAFRAHRWLPLLTGQIALVNAISLGMLFVIGPSLYAHVKNGPQSWGFVTSCIGVGALLGSLIVLRFAFELPLLMIQLCIAIMAAPLILLALHAPLFLLMLSSGVLGIGMAMANVIFQTTLQHTIKIELLSRVGSIVQLVAMGLIPVGYALSGPADAVFGARRSVGIGACCIILSVIWLSLVSEIRLFRQPDEGPSST